MVSNRVVAERQGDRPGLLAEHHRCAADSGGGQAASM